MLDCGNMNFSQLYRDLYTRKIKYGITHNGVFHMDDVMCSVFLKRINPFIEIIRTNDVTPYINKEDCLIYDIGMGKFDHHQPLEEKVKRNDGTPYCAFGLLWKELGATYLREDYLVCHPFDPFDPFINLDAEANVMWQLIDGNFVYNIDYTDNNGLYTLDFEDTYLIQNANPNFTENQEDPSFFKNALKIGELIFDKYLLFTHSQLEYNRTMQGKFKEPTEKILEQLAIIKQQQIEKERKLNDDLDFHKKTMLFYLKSNKKLEGSNKTLKEYNSLSQNLPYFVLDKFYPISKLFRFKTAPISEKNWFKPELEPKCFIISPSIRAEGFQINKIYNYSMEDVYAFLPESVQNDITFIHTSGMTATSKTVESAITLVNTTVILKTNQKIYQAFLDEYNKSLTEKEKYNLSFLENALLDISLNNPEVFDKILSQNDKKYLKDAFNKVKQYNILFSNIK